MKKGISQEKKKKILIVEDEYSLMHSISQELSDKFDVLMARNGRQGFEYAKKHKPDLILLDILLPEMSGEDMITQLRKYKWFKDTKVVVLSNLDYTDVRKHFAINGVSDYIVKCNISLKSLSLRLGMHIA